MWKEKSPPARKASAHSIGLALSKNSTNREWLAVPEVFRRPSEPSPRSAARSNETIAGSLTEALGFHATDLDEPRDGS